MCQKSLKSIGLALWIFLVAAPSLVAAESEFAPTGGDTATDAEEKSVYNQFDKHTFRKLIGQEVGWVGKLQKVGTGDSEKILVLLDSETDEQGKETVHLVEVSLATAPADALTVGDEVLVEGTLSEKCDVGVDRVFKGYNEVGSTQVTVTLFINQGKITRFRMSAQEAPAPVEAKLDSNRKDPTVRLVTKEVSLGKLQIGIVDTSLTVSPDCKRLAYAVHRGGKWSVVVDDVPGKEYDRVAEIAFSSDSKRIAYAARRGGKFFVVVDRVEGKEYDGIGEPGVVFGTDSKRFVYVARRGDNWFVIVDEGEGRPYDQVNMVVLSPDSKRVAYAAKRGDKWVAVVDNKQGRQYDLLDAPSFSPDSKRVALRAKYGSKYRVVVDEEEGKEYDGIMKPIVFSPDGKRVAYGAKHRDKFLVVVDEEEEEEYDALDVPLFSPDSKRVAFRANERNKYFIVVDGKERKQYDGIMKGSLLFSPDSKRIGYAAKRGQKPLVVVDEVEGKEYDRMNIPMFSADSKRVAYPAARAGKWFFVVDQAPGKQYDSLWETTSVFSPDSKWVAYAAERGGKSFLVVAGIEGKEYLGFLRGAGVHFDGPNSLHTAAFRDDHFFRVEVQIVEESARDPHGGVEGAKSGLTLDLGGSVQMEFMLIRPGTFVMGDPEGFDDEKPVHKVTITSPFYIGKYEVTQEQWQAVMGNNPSYFKGPKNPVEMVTWNDCQTFMKKLNGKSTEERVQFALPTEAQWEYACRAGTTTRYSFGNDKTRLNDYAWHPGNSERRTHPAGQKKSNAWGLHDMHGNVWEWCSDWYDHLYYAKSPPRDPKGPSSGEHHVLRGGSFARVVILPDDLRRACRAAPPVDRYVMLGFRPAASVDSEP